jgi:hypothetical protein
VQKLDTDAATKMFKMKVGWYFSKDAARELVTHYFDGLPLAIATKMVLLVTTMRPVRITKKH